ncbi:hypothetical protein [Frigidibacter sp. MR17.24]|uniref:hypothetical protein n=1 Tax=Frigidibacter sp. MR17.24 TaxID=3127345 RepID=UPI003012EFB3
MKTPPLQVSSETVTSIRKMLTALPPKPKTALTARETVHTLADDIRTALGRGYSHADIAERLATSGMKITAGTLASYLRELKTSDRKLARRPGRMHEAAVPDALDADGAGDGTTAPACGCGRSQTDAGLRPEAPSADELSEPQPGEGAPAAARELSGISGDARPERPGGSATNAGAATSLAQSTSAATAAACQVDEAADRTEEPDDPFFARDHAGGMLIDRPRGVGAESQRDRVATVPSHQTRQGPISERSSPDKPWTAQTH